MPGIELTAGTIEYEDTGGDGPVVVLLHGLVLPPPLDFARAGGAPIATVWRGVIAGLRADHRVIAPTLPYGAHRRPMSRPPTPDLVNELVAELLDRLDLSDVTLAENDCGRAQTVAARHPVRLARLVLIACEAFDNHPPGLPGKMIGAACRVPGGVSLLVRTLGLKPLRRLPVGIGALTKRPCRTRSSTAGCARCAPTPRSGATSATAAPMCAAPNCWRPRRDCAASTGPRSSSGLWRT